MMATEYAVMKVGAVSELLNYETNQALSQIPRPALHLHPAAAQPMEERSHHQRDRTAPRGVQAPDQNPDSAAVRRDCSDVVLGTARLRSDHYAQSRRMAEPDPETRR